MRVTIRAARPEDAKAIFQIIRDELFENLSAADTAHILARLCVNRKHKVFSAEVDGQVVGFLHISDYESILLRDQLKNITAIAVAASYRHIGIGRALLGRAEHWAEEYGAKGVRLDYHPLLAASADFFRACGFQGNVKYFQE